MGVRRWLAGLLDRGASSAPGDRVVEAGQVELWRSQLCVHALAEVGIDAQAIDNYGEVYGLPARARIMVHERDLVAARRVLDAGPAPPAGT